MVPNHCLLQSGQHPAERMDGLEAHRNDVSDFTPQGVKETWHIWHIGTANSGETRL